MPNMFKRNVENKINCNDCIAFYVGQTDRKLKIRLAKQYNHIRRKIITRSVITYHKLHAITILIGRM